MENIFKCPVKENDTDLRQNPSGRGKGNTLECRNNEELGF
jgi:hypothetical protein